MKGFRALVAFSLLFVVAINGLGQSTTSDDVDCDQQVSKAESEFNAGHFYGIPSILKNCLSGSKLSKEQLVKAYMVLCQTYMILDDPNAAGDNYLKLLKADPEFVPNEKDDPIEIVYLSKQYTATPIFTPHFRMGLNASMISTIYSLTTEPYFTNTAHPLRLGFQVGGGVDWNINDNFSVCLEADLASRGYERIETSGINTDESVVQASQWWFDVPIYAKYGFSLKDNKIRPFVYVGFAANFLLSASNLFTYTDNKSTGSQLVTEGPAESVVNQRNQFNRSFLFGGGIRYKVGKNFLFADLRYMGGMTNLANEAKLYYESSNTISPGQIGNPNTYMANAITRYHYVSDLFRMDNMSLTFGFVKPLYDPRKVKKARTKSVARAIRKEGEAKK